VVDLGVVVGSLPLSRDLSVGERIRAYRESRGLTREQLAQLVGRSEHWLYMIERGLRQPARYRDLAELARVLQATVADLIGRQEAARPERGGDQLAPLRAILAVPDALAPVLDDPVDLEELRADVRQLDRMAWASHLDELTPVLPEVLRRARAAGRQHDGDDRRAALGLLAQVYRGVSAVSKRVGDLGQARIAVERSWSAAGGSDDPTMRALAARVVSAFLLQEGRVAEARDVAVAATADLGHPSDVPGIAAWGSLVLAAAIGEARLGNAQGAAELLDEAEAGAIPMADNHHNWTTFGSTNVVIHRISAAIDLDRPDEAIRAAGHVQVDTLPAELAERRARYYIDVARAQALRGERDDAVDTLLRADRVMPGELRRHVAVRELVRDALRRQRRRSAGSDLARLARTVGVLPASH
jgi:transcriptional regulator with XRE-family HTH domain